MFFCQLAMSRAVDRALSAPSQAGHGPLVEGYPSPSLRPGAVISAVYVDNANLIAFDADSGRAALSAVCAELTTLGLRFHEVVDPTALYSALGGGGGGRSPLARVDAASITMARARGGPTSR